jgi:hypothetical protein
VDNLVDDPDVFNAEIMESACSPEGSAHIVRTVRRKGLTRAVVASCACCPLDFVCSACTDQRSRLKHGLFKGTGVSRSMVETVNIRGEALSLLAENPETAKSRFEGLLKRAVRRVKRVKALPVPQRSYNFTVAVIGSTEAAALRANLPTFLPALVAELTRQGVAPATMFFVEHGRMAVGDEVGRLVEAEVLCTIVGERPGLRTAESLGTYVTYLKAPEIHEARRSMISNIHAGGRPPPEGARQVAALCLRALRERRTGVDSGA